MSYKHATALTVTLPYTQDMFLFDVYVFNSESLPVVWICLLNILTRMFSLQNCVLGTCVAMCETVSHAIRMAMCETV